MSKITKIIHTGDIHIMNLRRQEEYVEQFNKFFSMVDDLIAKDGDSESFRIVVCGDIFHNKLDISGEAYTIAHWFLSELGKRCKTIVICGNHDVNMANLSRIDPITTLFNMSNLDNVVYLDKELNYESGCLCDENVIWCLFSSFDNFNRPNIEEISIEHPDKSLIGLFHGEIKGSKTDAGYQSENGLNADHFSGLDCCLCGHIHKRQILNAKGTKVIYSGSMIQKDHGENISGHGFGVWNVEDKTYEKYDIENTDYGFYTFSITDEEDIDNDKEKLLNL